MSTTEREALERAWRREMLSAIREAAAESVLFKGTTMTNGLRCIRSFERVNGVAYDPFNGSHRRHTRGMAIHENLTRRLAAIRSAADVDQ